MVRPAKISDYESFLTIKKKLALDVEKLYSSSYCYQVQKEGFLLNVITSKEKFQQDIERFFFAISEDNSICGYVNIDDYPEMPEETEVFWFNPLFKDLYYSLPHGTISKLGIVPEYRGKGIAKELLLEAIRVTKARNINFIFSFVVLSPLTNTASILFHEKNGFRRAAITSPRSLFGMKGYQSILYIKEI